jgi:hypothetical protein
MKPFTAFLAHNEKKLSKIVTVIVFLALIRSIMEPIRQPMSPTDQAHFAAGCLIAAIACMVITFLSYYSKYRAIIITGIITILALIIFKSLFMK